MLPSFHLLLWTIFQSKMCKKYGSSLSPRCYWGWIKSINELPETRYLLPFEVLLYEWLNILCTFLFQYYPQHMQFPPGNCSNSVCKKTAKGHRLLIFREKNNGREVPIKIRVSPCCCCFVGQLQTQCSLWNPKLKSLPLFWSHLASI